MAQHHRPKNNRLPPRGPANNRTLKALPLQTERRAPTQYGKPFMIMEDVEKNTFIYQGGDWVPHAATIADYRQSGLVKELPQRVNGRTRYEIRMPLGSAD